MRKKNILFYISGHGFGHSTRMMEVMNKLARLDAGISFFVRTSTPEWLFRRDMAFEFHYSYLVNDVGIVQKDSLSLNTLETLKQYARFITKKKGLIPKELEFVKKNNISLIVGDIPPLAFDVAGEAHLPGLAISNFSWDWIYSPYVREYPRYRYLLEDIGESYSKADKLLRLPFHGEMSVFPVIEDIPLVARRSEAEKKGVFKRLGISPAEERKIILLSFGGFNYPPQFFDRVTGCENYLFISSRKIISKSSSPRVVVPSRESHLRHQDLVKVSDLVMAKPGYGIVSECIVNRTPIMYTSSDSAEYKVLVPALKKYAHSYFIPREELREGNWEVHLDDFFKTKYDWPELRGDGAEEASKRILEY